MHISRGLLLPRRRPLVSLYSFFAGAHSTPPRMKIQRKCGGVFRGVKAAAGGGEGMGDKGVDEALNENAPYFTRLTNADESVTGLNFCREDASKGSDNALM